MTLDKFMKLYDNRIFNPKIDFRLEVKMDYGIAHSSFKKISEELYPYFEVKKFELPTVSYGVFTDKEYSQVELHIYIKTKKHYKEYIDCLVMRSKAYEITL
jgi:hypothetical protein